MPYTPAGDLTSKKLTVLVPSATAIPEGKALDVLPSSALVVANLNASGLCQSLWSLLPRVFSPGHHIGNILHLGQE